MASPNTIVKLADFPRPVDPALAAWERMQTATTDNEYEAARSALLKAVPRSLEGVRAKQALGLAIIDSVSEGDELTERGRKELSLLLSAVGQFAARIAA